MPRQLTDKQEKYKNLRVKGVTGPDAYREAYNTSASPANISKASQKLDKNPLIAPLLKQNREEVTERALCDAEWVVKGLMREASGVTDEDVGLGSTGASRVAALKALSDFTGGFDNNKQKVEVEEKVVTIIDLTGNDHAN